MRFDMRKILLLAFCFISLNSFAQDLTITPDPVALSVPDGTVDMKVDMNISNNLGRDVEFYWSIDRGNVPDEWQFYLCDINLCYTPSVQSCPCSKPNLLGPNESGTLMLHILPNGVNAVGVVTLSILTECDGTTSEIDIPVTYEVGTTSTNFAELNKNINLYPNPAFDNIQLQEDDNVEYLEIYNIVGKQVKTLTHSQGQSHDVSDLNKGIYLVRLLDKSNNILKVIRMTMK